jgi:hypothetical protein
LSITSTTAGVSINAATGSYLITLTGAQVFTPNAQITLGGFRGTNIKGLNGPCRIISTPTQGVLNQVLTTRVPKAAGTPNITQFGNVLYRPPNFFAISSCQLVRIITHRTGRPFFVSRGRRTA